MGSYFGSSLCAVDLNQDGLSDLLVGAPMHSQLRDEGQVSVYLSKGNVSGMCWGQRERDAMTRRVILLRFVQFPSLICSVYFCAVVIVCRVDFCIFFPPMFNFFLTIFVILIWESNSGAL